MTPKDRDQCPSCNANLKGDSIWETFRNNGDSIEEADRKAEMYGATRTEGHWERAIGIYDRDKDRTVAYLCPHCGHEWPRPW